MRRESTPHDSSRTRTPAYEAKDVDHWTLSRPKRTSRREGMRPGGREKAGFDSRSPLLDQLENSLASVQLQCHPTSSTSCPHTAGVHKQDALLVIGTGR